MQTYRELLESLSERADGPCQSFVGEVELSRSAGEVLAAARESGARLCALGLGRGDRVGLMVSEPEEFLPLMHGALLYGLVAVPLYPPPLFGKLEAHSAAMAAVVKAADARVLVVSNGARARLASRPAERVVEVSELPCAEVAEPPAIGPADLAFLQFTSGSTGTPKGVCVSHATLMANARAIMVDGLAAGASDRGVSWLPLYHDMGLIGFGLAPPLTRTPVTFIAPWNFIRNPSIWLKTITRVGGTITFAPNFAYALATRRVAPKALDLSTMRMWGCAAEPVSPNILDAFEQRFAACGVRQGQISPCYGLAEATLAVTFTPPSAGRLVDEIDAETLERDARAEPAKAGRTARYVSCGKPLAAHHVQIVDEAGQLLPERAVGEIVVRGPSVNSGYFQSKAQSAKVFREDGLHTGDLGYLVDGQLYVTGRIKDIVIVGGRNYDPGVIEAAAMSVHEVRLAAALGTTTAGGEELTVLVERRAADDARLVEQVRASIAASVGIHAARIVCVALGSLPRTTSGKLKRDAARVLISDDSAANRSS